MAVELAQSVLIIKAQNRLYQLTFVAFLLAFSTFAFTKTAEEVLKEMTVEEKIGQLFVLPACPKHEKTHLESLKALIENRHLGGIIMKQSQPLEQVPFLNQLQGFSRRPLLVTADAEWGLGMRMKETISFPKNLTLGAIQDNQMIYDLGHEIGEQCRRVGIHLNFAPVADLNTNPRNPIIHTRSFGENPEIVSEKVCQFVRGMESAGVAACIKHFPGHGDVEVDSHKALPVIPYGKDRLESIEFFPFKRAIASRVSSVMTGHLYLPECDPVLPASLSPLIVQKLLKKEWGYSGLVITDALNMKALTLHYEPEEIALRAFLAGHDLLLYGAHKENDVIEILTEIFPRAYQGVVKGFQEGVFSEERLNQSVLKILQLKERLGLFENRMTQNSSDLMERLHAPNVYQLKERLFRSAVAATSKEIPLIDGKKVAYIQVGKEGSSALYESATPFDLSAELIPELSKYDIVVIAIYPRNQKWEESFGLNEEERTLFKKIHRECKEVVFTLFGTPYALEALPKESQVLIGYEAASESEEAIFDVLMGREKAKGKLPVTVWQQ